MHKILEDIKVLDLTRLLPGPLCTLYLAELGAKVTKIEPPEGDYTKNISKHAYEQLNQHKNIITLDLKNEEARKEFYELVKTADVVVESFRPGVTTELRVDFQTLTQINSSLVYCSITGYGQSGPYKNYPGHDINYLATSGILGQMSGLANFQIADLAGGSLSSCVGILAALLDSQKTKKPHHIDISMLDCVMGLNQVALATYQRKHQDIPAGKDLLNGGLPFYGVYETKDKRQMALGALEFKFWKNFCETVSKPGWVGWHTAAPSDYPSISKEITELFKSKTMQDWMILLENVECCASGVLTLSEVHENPQVAARGMVEKQSHEGQEIISYKFPINFLT